jgi:transcriptional repressor NrdR
VVKRDGTRQEFDAQKILNSMILACGKRPVPVESLRDTVSSIERDLYQEHDDEVASTEIGERVMRALRDIDTVAYVRFASVYQEFESISDFSTILKRCKSPSGQK